MFHLQRLHLPHVTYRCVVSESRGGVRIKQSFHGYPIYELGVSETPRYRVHTNDADHPWSLEHADQGRLFGTSMLNHEPLRMPSSLGFRGVWNDSLAVVPQLPEGEYLVCEFPEGGAVGREVLMGNHYRQSAGDVLSFGRSTTCDDDHVSISAFGRRAGTPVDVGQVLVGVTFLDFIGCGHNITGIWLFNMIEESVLPPLVNPTAIVPVTGALVPRWWPNDEHLRWWREHAAEAIEKVLG